MGRYPFGAPILSRHSRSHVAQFDRPGIPCMTKGEIREILARVVAFVFWTSLVSGLVWYGFLDSFYLAVAPQMNVGGGVFDLPEQTGNQTVERQALLENAVESV